MMMYTYLMIAISGPHPELGRKPKSMEPSERRVAGVDPLRDRAVVADDTGPQRERPGVDESGAGQLLTVHSRRDEPMATRYITNTWGDRVAVAVPDTSYEARWIDAVKTTHGTHRIASWIEIVDSIEDINGRGYDLRHVGRMDPIVRVLPADAGGMAALERLEKRIENEEFFSEGLRRDRQTSQYRSHGIGDAPMRHGIY